MIRLHIFDMDGTVLDSMRMWENLCSDFLRSLGYLPDDAIQSITDHMTFHEAVHYMANKYDLGSLDETMQQIESYVVRRYSTDLPLFDGISEDLARIHASGVPMVILTNSWHVIAEAALGRTGVLPFFDAIYTFEDLKVTKRDPESFRKVCALYGVAPEEALVHDDADYAITAALKAGCRVKVYDRYR